MLFFIHKAYCYAFVFSASKSSLRKENIGSFIVYNWQKKRNFAQESGGCILLRHNPLIFNRITKITKE